MDDEIKRIVNEINSFVVNNSRTADPVNLHFDILDAVFENLTSFCSVSRIVNWSKDEEDLVYPAFLAGRQNSFFNLAKEYLITIDSLLKEETFYETAMKVSSQVSEISELISKKFPADSIEKFELLKKKKQEYARLISLEEEVKGIDESKLSEELNRLKSENGQKSELLEQKKLLITEIELLDRQISEIEANNISSKTLIVKLNSLIDEVQKTGAARNELYKIQFSELEEEKSRLEKIEKDINDIDDILNTGLVGVEIANFYPADFNRSEIEKLSSEINSLRLKIKSLIEKKEKIAMNLKGDNNA